MVSNAAGPLQGLRVLDLSIIVAGGMATAFMADFGAEVVKVERPEGGDPLRQWGPFVDGVSLWWKVHSRNKKSITLNLGHPEGQRVLKALASRADLMVESFRPGTLERWGLGYDVLSQVNPRLVLLRVSGFGQTGPYRERPGFGTIAECMSGLVGMTGFPDTPPVLPPVPMADEIAGIVGAMAALMALYHRDALGNGRGQVVDVSLFEPLFRLLVPHVPMYDLLKVVRERVGNDFPDAAPRTLYKTADGRWLGLSATSQGTWEDLAKAMGMPELLQDPRFKTNSDRMAHRQELNQALQDWFGRRTQEEALGLLIPAGGVVGPVYNIAQVLEDPHYQARGDIIQVEDPELGRTKMVGLIPKLSATPGAVEHAGPRLGEHNTQVYGSWLGYTQADVQRLQEGKVI
ncbi:MAG: CoA transferase [Chloroflexi bacterium]|nr:CoA transferase [Chloroflexota bacterium]